MLEQTYWTKCQDGPQATNVLYPFTCIEIPPGLWFKMGASLILGNAPVVFSMGSLSLKLKISLFLLPNAFPFYVEYIVIYFIFLNFLFCIEVQLINSVVMVTSEE